MLSTATVAAIRNIGRPVDRQPVAPRCPERVAYFGWTGGLPGSVTAAVANAATTGRCCPPTMPQRNALQAAGVVVVVCCAGTSWAILPNKDDANLQAAGAWLRRFEPTAPVDCTTITPAGPPLPADTDRLAALNRGRGPQPIRRAGYQRGGFSRAPVHFGGPPGYCPSMCVIGGVDVVKWNKCGVPTPPKVCLAPSAPSNFAETAWCAAHAAATGPLGVKQCTNAAMGLGTPSGAVKPPPSTYPICKTGKDCAG